MIKNLICGFCRQIIQFQFYTAPVIKALEDLSSISHYRNCTDWCYFLRKILWNLPLWFISIDALYALLSYVKSCSFCIVAINQRFMWSWIIKSWSLWLLIKPHVNLNFEKLNRTVQIYQTCQMIQICGKNDQVNFLKTVLRSPWTVLIRLTQLG